MARRLVVVGLSHDRGICIRERKPTGQEFLWVVFFTGIAHLRLTSRLTRLKMGEIISDR